jgi:dTDP-D-glucose 4,6-dehydratase
MMNVLVTGDAGFIGSNFVRHALGLAETVAWYRQNDCWWSPIKEADPAFQPYYQTQYGNRRG